MGEISENSYIERAKKILETARNQIVKSIHHSMVYAYYEIGRIVVEE